jgi:competence protein ComEC
MKASILSKFSSFGPVELVIAFAFGVLVGSSFIKIPERAIILIWPLFAIVLLAIIFKIRFAVVAVVSFIFGFVFMLCNSLTIFSSIPQPVCQEAHVNSFANKSGANFEYKVAGKSLNSVIVLDSDTIVRYGQKIKLCFSSSDVSAVDPGQIMSQMARSGSIYKISKPKIEIISDGGYFPKLVNKFLGKIKEIAQIVFPGDEGVLARGLVFGGSQDFSSQFKSLVRRSGVSHLTAVSGYNVSIIVILLFGFVRTNISRRSAFASTIVVLAFFWFITGGSASVTRAGIMGLIVLVGGAIGRPNSVMNSLFVASLVMLIVNPFILWDVGFKLSFIATFGLVYLSPFWEPITQRLNASQFIKSLGLVLAETTSAQIFTLPVLLYYFGQISLIGLVTNLLLLPLVPLSMAAISLTILFGFMSIKIALVAGLFADLILIYFMAVIKFLGGLKYAQIQLPTNNLLLCLTLMLVIIATSYVGTIMVKKKYEGKSIAKY